MDSFICTPNTKLRRDTEFLGPFAAVLHPQLSKVATTTSTTTSTTTTIKSAAGTTTKKTQEKNLNVFHKKGSKQQDIDARRETRARQEANRKKDNRFQAIMDKRVQGSTILAKESTKANVLKNTENKVDGRREQLLRWKEQKAAAENLTNNRAKPSSVNVSKQAKGQSTPYMNGLSAPRKRPPTGVKIDQNNLNNKPPQKQNVVKSTATSGGERRVTRAMAKGTTTTNTCPYNVNLRPALAKLKNLAIVPQTFTLSTANAIANSTSANVVKKSSSVESLKSKVNPLITKPPVQNSNNVTKKSNINSKDKSNKMVVVAEEPAISDSTQDVTQVIEEIVEVAPAAPPKKVVKAKGMQFDEVYVEYNNKFVAAGSLLMHEINNLSKVIEVSKDIPEDVLSDIESTLGQAKLLMDSKLPQFGQLLYFYLSKENNPNRILPCDLQGWWDVAIIQVEKVKARFDELRILEKNGWKKLEAIIPPLNKDKVLKSMKKSEGVKSSDSSSASETSSLANKKKNAQASSGLRQFLANKRRNVNQVQDQLSTVSENLAQGKEEAPPQKERSDDPENKSASLSSPTRKFEGGFFEVTTPIRTSITNPNGCTPRSNKRNPFRANASGTPTPSITPGAKGLPRASLVTLAVRKSMGSMFKTELESQLTNTELTSDPQPMDSCNPTPLLPRGSFSENEECSRLDRINMSLENSASADRIEALNYQPTNRRNSYNSESQSNKAIGFQMSGATPTTTSSCNNPYLNYESLEIKQPTSGFTRSTNFSAAPHHNYYHHHHLPSSTEADSDREFKTINLYSGNCENWYTETNSSSTSNSNSTSRKPRRWPSSKSSGRVTVAETELYDQPQPSQYRNGQKKHLHRQHNICHKNNNNNTESVQRIVGRPPEKLESQYVLRFNLKHKCFFSRSFHHFMDKIKQEDLYFQRIAGTKKNRTKHRRRAENNIFVHVQGNEEGGGGEEEEDKFPVWSPFSYDQSSIFNNSLLSSELQLIYSDWPKELTVIDSDGDNDEMLVKKQNKEDQEKTENVEQVGTIDEQFISKGASSNCFNFLDKCLNSGSSYCEIFGAQNVMDLHPEFSPFDDTIDIERSLVTKHLSKIKNKKKEKKTNLESDQNMKMNIGQEIVKTSTMHNQLVIKNLATTAPTNTELYQTEHETIDLIQSEVEREEDSFESADIFDESKFSIPRSIQCKVCDIYHSLKSRRKLNNFTGICTNCGSMVASPGHFMDITPRKEVYTSKTFPRTSSQPSSDDFFQNNENGSD